MDYGLSDQMSQGDPRHPVWAAQRQARGFDDTELWNLDVTLAKIMHPRLVAYRELVRETQSHPSTISAAEWDQKLELMIEAFDLLRDDANTIPSKAETAKIEHGLDLFRKHLRQLWT